MPFLQAFPRPFQQTAIHSFAPPVSGVYGISNGRDWLYIADTPNIRESLMAILVDPGAGIHAEGPRGFVFEIVGPTMREQRRRRLVLDLHPICNWPE